MQLRAILIDDEKSNLSSLKEKLARNCPDVEIIAMLDNAKDGKGAIDSLHPDIVFLDIEMPVMNGFVMLQQLNYKNFELIFVTAYDHYAIKAIRDSALDYLVKPIEIRELTEAVGRAADKRSHPGYNQQLEVFLDNIVLKKNMHRQIAIPTLEGLQFIRTDEILYLEANINYTHIYMKDKKKLIVSRTLKDFEDLLPASTFLRIHNSYIINKDYLEKYERGEGGQVIMSNGIRLDVSKRKKADFLKAIGY